MVVVVRRTVPLRRASHGWAGYARVVRVTVRCREVVYPGSDPRVEDELEEGYGGTRRVGLEREGGGRGEDDVQEVVWVRGDADEE